jgi:hypothetical protein
VCTAASTFAPYPGQAKGWVVTSAGPTLWIEEDDYPSDPISKLVSYSWTGASSGPVTISDGIYSGERAEVVEDLAAIGDELFVVGRRPAPGYTSAPAYVQKLGANGSVVWEKSLGTNNDYIASVAAAGGEGQLYVVAALYPQGAGEARMQLYVLDAADGSLQQPALPDSLNGGPSDVQVASSGHIFVAGVGTAEYLTDAWRMVTEIDASGNVYAQQSFDSDYTAQLEPDDAGGVYLLGSPLNDSTDPAAAVLHHLGPSGTDVSSVPISLSEWGELEAFTLDDQNLIFAGDTTDHPVMVTTDTSGQGGQEQILTERSPHAETIGLIVTPSQTRLIVGTSLMQSAIDPVAFIAPWPATP